ncbi:MAG: XRE family transcriptional regulator [Pyrinomonadaceae bacterium]|nr:XRE family transcriptional regulator [Pyrinomonadaceae bacterium]
MDAKRRKAIEEAGWSIGDAADFLEMTAEERQLLDARVELALAIRRQRQSCGLSQKELGAKLKTTQPRVAKIERAASDVSMDQLIRAFTAAGGKFVIRTRETKTSNRKNAASKKRSVVVKAVTMGRRAGSTVKK